MVNNPKLHSKSRQRRSRAAAAADPPVSRLLSLVDSTRAAEIVDKVLKNRLVGDPKPRGCKTAQPPSGRSHLLAGALSRVLHFGGTRGRHRCEGLWRAAEPES